jgi:hypothetical protein
MLKVFSFEPDTRKTDDSKTSPFLANRTPLAYYDKETAFLNELYVSVKDKKFTQLIPDKNLRNILKNAKSKLKRDNLKQSWSQLEAEPPSKKK